MRYFCNRLLCCSSLTALFIAVSLDIAVASETKSRSPLVISIPNITEQSKNSGAFLEFVGDEIQPICRKNQENCSRPVLKGNYLSIPTVDATDEKTEPTSEIALDNSLPWLAKNNAEITNSKSQINVANDIQVSTENSFFGRIVNRILTDSDNNNGNDANPIQVSSTNNATEYELSKLEPAAGGGFVPSDEPLIKIPDSGIIIEEDSTPAKPAPKTTDNDHVEKSTPVTEEKKIPDQESKIIPTTSPATTLTPTATETKTEQEETKPNVDAVETLIAPNISRPKLGQAQESPTPAILPDVSSTTTEVATQEPALPTKSEEPKEAPQPTEKQLTPKKEKQANKAKTSKPSASKTSAKVKKPEPAKKASDEKTEEAEQLSPESKKIIGTLKPPTEKKSAVPDKVSVSHSHDMQDLFSTKDTPEQPQANEALGVKVERKTQGLNIDYELERAYNAISGGNSDEAIDIYQTILKSSPNNKQALFGLATLYHRARQIDKARPLYAKLLAIDPQNRDGFNNFLVLLADEAPKEALTELAKLEEKNPSFSTIPAQMAVIYQKTGDFDKAIDKMFRAVSLAPENITYRYNLAVMLDKQKNYDEAAKLYRQLLEAAARGEKIPGKITDIQQRLTFISSNRP